MGMGDWQEYAACKSVDSSLFYPDRETRGSAQAALSVCDGCPVREQCLDYALSFIDQFGVWGGKTEHERRRMRLQRLKAKAG